MTADQPSTLHLPNLKRTAYLFVFSFLCLVSYSCSSLPSLTSDSTPELTLSSKAIQQSTSSDKKASSQKPLVELSAPRIVRDSKFTLHISAAPQNDSEIKKIVLYVSFDRGSTWEKKGVYNKSEATIDINADPGQVSFFASALDKQGNRSKTPDSETSPLATVLVNPGKLAITPETTNTEKGSPNSKESNEKEEIPPADKISVSESKTNKLTNKQRPKVDFSVPEQSEDGTFELEYTASDPAGSNIQVVEIFYSFPEKDLWVKHGESQKASNTLSIQAPPGSLQLFLRAINEKGVSSAPRPSGRAEEVTNTKTVQVLSNNQQKSKSKDEAKPKSKPEDIAQKAQSKNETNPKKHARISLQISNKVFKGGKQIPGSWNLSREYWKKDSVSIDYRLPDGNWNNLKQNLSLRKTSNISFPNLTAKSVEVRFRARLKNGSRTTLKTYNLGLDSSAPEVSITNVKSPAEGILNLKIHATDSGPARMKKTTLWKRQKGKSNWQEIMEVDSGRKKVQLTYDPSKTIEFYLTAEDTAGNSLSNPEPHTEPLATFTPPETKKDAPSSELQISFHTFRKGDVYRGGKQLYVAYSVQGNTKTIQNLILSYSPDNGRTWNSIDETTDPQGRVLWTLPETTTRNVRLRIQVKKKDGRKKTKETPSFTIDSSTPKAFPKQEHYSSKNSPLHIDYEVTGGLDNVKATGIRLWYRKNNHRKWKRGNLTSNGKPLMFRPEVEGEFDIYLTAQNEFGYESPAPKPEHPGMASVLVDRKSPVINVESGLKNKRYAGGEEIHLKWTAKDANLSRAPVQIFLESSNLKNRSRIALKTDLPAIDSRTISLPKQTLKKAYIVVHVQDKAGRTSRKKIGPIEIDSDVPAGSISVPDFVRNNTIPVSVTVDQKHKSDFAWFELWILPPDSSEWKKKTRRTSLDDVSVDVSRDGTYKLALIFADKLGNQTPRPKTPDDAQQQIVVDSTPPDIKTFSVDPDQDLFQGGNELTFHWRIQERNPGSKNPIEIDWKTDEESQWSSITSSNQLEGSFSWDLPEITGTNVQFRIVGKDRANRTSKRIFGPVKIDSAPPYTEELSGPKTSSEKRFNLKLHMKDQGPAGLKQYHLFIKPISKNRTKTAERNWKQIRTFDRPRNEVAIERPHGKYKFALRGVDQAGNESPDPSTLRNFTHEVTVNLRSPEWTIQTLEKNPDKTISIQPEVQLYEKAELDWIQLWWTNDGGNSWNKGEKYQKDQWSDSKQISFDPDQPGTYGFYLSVADTSGRQTSPPEPGTKAEKSIRIEPSNQAVTISTETEDLKNKIFRGGDTLKIDFDPAGKQTPPSEIKLLRKSKSNQDWTKVKTISSPGDRQSIVLNLPEKNHEKLFYKLQSIDSFGNSTNEKTIGPLKVDASAPEIIHFKTPKKSSDGQVKLDVKLTDKGPAKFKHWTLHIYDEEVSEWKTIDQYKNPRKTITLKLSNGTFHYALTAEDTAGNRLKTSFDPESALSSVTVKISPPDWTLNSPEHSDSKTFQLRTSVEAQGKHYLDWIELWWTVEDIDIWYKRYRINNPRKPFIQFEAEEDGTYGFYLVAADTAGYQSPPPTADTKPATTTIVDSTKPEISVQFPFSKNEVIKGGNQKQISWEINDATPNPDSVSLEWKKHEDSNWNRMFESIGMSGTKKWKIPEVTEENVRLRIRASDQLGHTSEHRSSPFSIDTSPPSINIESPKETFQETFQIKVDINDVGKGGVKNWSLYETTDEGKSWKKLSTHTKEEKTISLERDHGNYGYAIQAKDTLGNKTTSPDTNAEIMSKTFVNLSPPEIQMKSMEGLTFGKKETIHVEWDVLEHKLKENPIDLFYSPNGGTDWEPIVKDLENSGEYKWNPPKLSSRKVKIKIVAKSASGVKASKVSKNFSIITTPPKTKVLKATSLDKTNSPTTTDADSDPREKNTSKPEDEQKIQTVKDSRSGSDSDSEKNKQTESDKEQTSKDQNKRLRADPLFQYDLFQHPEVAQIGNESKRKKVEKLINSGLKQFDLGNFNKSVEYFRKAQKLHATAIQPIFLQLVTYLEMDHNSDEIQSVLKRLPERHENPTVQYWKTMALIQLGRLEEARQSILAIQQQDGRPEYKMIMGLINYHQGALNKAQKRFRTCIKLPDFPPRIHYHLAKTYLQKGNWNEAEKEFNTYLERGRNPVRKQSAKEWLNLISSR